MCGFITCIKNTNVIFPDLENSKTILNRRGPDSQNEFFDGNFYCYHTRLSIIDIDERSNQPLFSDCKRFLIVFNGEIYNYKELADGLLENNISLVTNSDTEVILKLYIKYKEKILPMLRGMFSFLIWDNLEKNGFVARDPYGIKPLYFFKNDDFLIFSSQLKSILFTGVINPVISTESLSDFFLLGSISEGKSIFNSINCFKSGFFMRINENKIIEYKQWFNVIDLILNSNKTNVLINDKLLLEKTIHNSLISSIRHHAVSDVRLGVFLSSGIDSSTIASLLKESGCNSFKGITVVFGEDSNNEISGAQLVAKELNISLYIKRVTKEEFLNDLHDIFQSMDQPSIDGINTWYASKAAAECNIKVVLSGVGGDELFQGYKYYNSLPFLIKISPLILNLKPIKYLFSLLFKLISKFTQNAKWEYITHWMSDSGKAWLLRRSFLVPSEIKSISEDNISQLVSTLFSEPHSHIITDPTLVLTKYDTFLYLKNQLLRDSDWASMYHGVELRTPFVDHFLLNEISPYFRNFKNYKNKQLMFNNLKFKLPDAIIKRKKTGFEFPAKKWLRDSFNVNSKFEYAEFILAKYKDSLKLSSN